MRTVGVLLLTAALAGASGARCAEVEDAEPLITDGVAPKADAFGHRSGAGRKKSVARFGGSPATEGAVEAALRWLARHQEADGRWAGEKWGSKSEKYCSPALTGLALSAFLGAGYTHKAGKYRDNVSRGIRWLLGQQDRAHGGILGKEGWRYSHYDGYTHPMASAAVIEAYGMTGDAALKGPAQATVQYSIKVHQKPFSGWRYKPKQEGDLSITAWFVQQLASAKAAGLTVDPASFQGAMALIGKLTNPRDGRTVYTVSQTGSFARDLPPTSFDRRAAMGMVCRQKMGTPRTDRTLQLSCARVLKFPPAADRPDLYGWYYGTQACFQMGGNVWRTWNAALTKTLLETQRKGGPMDGSENDVDGSWDFEKDLYGKKVGRTFTAAMGAMCLETYYRYAFKR